MFKQILVALDGSAQSDSVLDCAIGLARKSSATVAVCSVADPASAVWQSQLPPVAERVVAQARHEAVRIVNHATDRARAAGISAAGTVRVGNPAREIVACADETHADAIVVGTHGRKGLGRAFMGSVAEGVVRHASCPVVVVK